MTLFKRSSTCHNYEVVTRCGGRKELRGMKRMVWGKMPREWRKELRGMKRMVLDKMPCGWRKELRGMKRKMLGKVPCGWRKELRGMKRKMLGKVPCGWRRGWCWVKWPPVPMLELRLLRGLCTVTMGKNTFSCEYSNVTSFPRKIWNTVPHVSIRSNSNHVYN